MSLHLSKSSTYNDRDGQIKNFTTVDWSPKLSVAFDTSDYDPDWKAKFRANLLERLSGINPVYCNPIFRAFVQANQEEGKLEWNMVMLSDEGFDVNNLSDIVVMAENAEEIHKSGGSF